MSERPNDTTMFVPAARPVPKTWSGRIVVLLLVALSPVLVAGAFLSGYLVEDQASLAVNPLAQSGDLGKALGETFAKVNQPLNGPLAQLTVGLQYRASGAYAWSLRLVSLLIHIASAWILYRVILNVVPRGAPLCAAEEPINADAPFNTKRQVVAAFGALFFFLHPLTVDAVAAVAHRGVVQAVFFALLSWWLMVRQGADRTTWRRLKPPAWQAYLLSLLCLGLAVLSCPMFCGWAGVLLLTELFWIRDESAGTWGRAAGLAAAGAVCVWLSSDLWLQGVDQRLTGDGALVAFQALGRGILNIVAPTGLSSIYAAVSVDGASDPRIWLAVGLLAVVLVVPIWLPLGIRPATVLLGGALMVVLPSLASGTPHASTLANPTLYLILPIVGVLFGLGAEAVQYRFRFIGKEGGKIGETVGFGLVVFLFLLMSLLSVARSFAFRSEEALMRDAVARQPRSYMANLRLAEELSRQAREIKQAGGASEAGRVQWLEAREFVDALRFAVDRKHFEDPGRQLLLEGEVEYRLGIEGGKEKIRFAVPLLDGQDGRAERARALMLEIGRQDESSIPPGDTAPNDPGELIPLEP